jgi:hypothetical protein
MRTASVGTVSADAKCCKGHTGSEEHRLISPERDVFHINNMYLEKNFSFGITVAYLSYRKNWTYESDT